METSFDGLNLSEVFALHRALMEFLYKYGTPKEISGPCHILRVMSYYKRHGYNYEWNTSGVVAQVTHGS